MIFMVNVGKYSIHGAYGCHEEKSQEVLLTDSFRHIQYKRLIDFLNHDEVFLKAPGISSSRKVEFTFSRSVKVQSKL